MSCTRVIPRDLFNEANLMKCYAQIYLNLEKMNVDAHLTPPNEDEGFHIIIDEGTGGTSISNVQFLVGGEPVELFRPLNSREDWPLYMMKEDGEEISVFEDNGKFTYEFNEFLYQFPTRKKEAGLSI